MAYLPNYGSKHNMLSGNQWLMFYNLSLSQGICVFPSELKLARVVPLFNGGDSAVVENYWPGPLLPILSGFREACLQQFSISGLPMFFFKYQFGFQKSHSTNLALGTLIDFIMSHSDANQSVLSISLDFSKAFDTDSPWILFGKLNKFGVWGVALSCFKKYSS